MVVNGENGCGMRGFGVVEGWFFDMVLRFSSVVLAVANAISAFRNQVWAFLNSVRRYCSGFKAVFICENGGCGWRCGESAVQSAELVVGLAVCLVGFWRLVVAVSGLSIVVLGFVVMFGRFPVGNGGLRVWNRGCLRWVCFVFGLKKRGGRLTTFPC